MVSIIGCCLRLASEPLGFVDFSKQWARMPKPRGMTRLIAKHKCISPEHSLNKRN